jgi:uncharacterized protein (TIGR03083 family)
VNDHHDVNDVANTDGFIDDLTDQLGLGEVMAALAETVASTPPPEVRSGLLATLAERPRQPVTPAPVPDLYARRVTAMSALLDDLTESDWTMPADPYEWTVHGLVAHLTVIEEYTLRQLGLTDLSPLPAGASGATQHLDYGSEAIAEMIAEDPGVTVRRWRTAADRIVEHVHSATFDLAAPTPLHAWPFDASIALVARAFEIWTHADDIRRATARPLDVPSPAELRTMSSTSVGGLPVLLTVTGGPPMQPTRVVLTGSGGGTFDLGRTGDGHAAVQHLLVADIVDYCRLVARRVDPADLAGHRDGDEQLLGALLRAASAIAV